MTDQHFVSLAIEEAKKSQAAGGAPIGAVLVKEGKVVATGWSLVSPKNDPTAHPETTCMKLACSLLNSLDLSACTLYSTLEPCSMCLSCAGWTGLSRNVFGAYREDIPENPYELDSYHAEVHAQRVTPLGGGTLTVQGGVLREECALLMSGIKNWSAITP